MPLNDAEVRNGFLYMDGQRLHVERHSPTVLDEILHALGREAIVGAIETAYQEKRLKHPHDTLTRPSIFAIELGRPADTILSEFGQNNPTALHRFSFELSPHLRPYWDIVLKHGYTPITRSRLNFGEATTSWLQLRNPETDPAPFLPLEHLPVALGFVKPGLTRDIFKELEASLATSDRGMYRALWQQLENENEAAIDRSVSGFGKRILPALQIGRIVAVANMRAHLHDGYLYNKDGYLAAIIEAEEGAYRYAEQGQTLYDFHEVSSLLKTEIERLKRLQIT